MSKLHFISGLPRSGSTLLAGLLRQNPRFAAAIRDLVLERAAAERGDEVTPCALGALGASHNLCPVGCCPGRAPRPAAAGADSPDA